ncbi:MAG: hypothetical protein V7603_5979 [Micromonosporaceae bacterium]
MRAQIGLLLVALTAAAGCAASTPSAAADTTDSPIPATDVRANGRAACVAVRKVTDTYAGDILGFSGERLTTRTQQWSAAIGRAARGADDTVLRTALLSLADVVRGWAVRPPDRTKIRGFQNDLEVACRPFLTNSS